MGSRKEDPKQIEFIYRSRFQEIFLRRHWLLSRNKKFNHELKKSGMGLIFSQVSKAFDRYSKTLHLPTYPPEIEKILQKYHIGENWPDGKVLYRIGEKPLGLEIIGVDEKPEYARIIIFPGETTLEDIKQAWKYFELTFKKFFKDCHKDLQYSLKNKNFWRDAEWYMLLKEKKYTIDEILEFMKKDDPLTLDRLFIEHIIDENKKEDPQFFLDDIDPNRKILNNKRINSYKKISQLLFAAGVLKIGIAQTNLARLKIFDPVNSEEKYSQVIPGKKYYIRFDSFEKFPNLFKEVKETDAEIKTKEGYRKQFYLKMKEDIYFTIKSEGLGFKHVVEEAVKRMQKKIDQIV